MKLMEEENVIKDMEVFPFSDIVYNAPEYEEIWKPKIEKAGGLFHKLEYKTVKEKKRKCATIHLRPQNFDEQIERIQEDGLVWLPLRRTETYSGFSHRHYNKDRIDMNTSVYGVLSHDIEYAREFKNASERPVNHEILAELLGFPECCASKFTDSFAKFRDPLFQAAEESGEKVDDTTIKTKINIGTHQLLRYAGFRIASHLPCSFDCENSQEVSKNIWIPTAKEFYPEEYKILKEILMMEGSWSVNHGVVVVTLPLFTVVSNSIPTKEEYEVIWEEVID